jgi:hypothetical protein
LGSFYGSSSWQNSVDKKIVLVCHSQGGLIARNLFREYTSTSLTNPVNHIAKIVTIGTPHKGSEWAKPIPTIEPLRWLKVGTRDASRILDRIGKGENNLSQLLKASKELDGSNSFLQNLNASSYPLNRYTGNYVPMVALYATTPGISHMLGVYSNVLVNDDWSNVFSAWFLSPFDKDIISVLNQFELNWEKISDFVVDVESQKLGGVYQDVPLRTQPIVAKDPIPHSTISLDRKLYGETYQAVDLYNAIVDSFKATLVTNTILLN